MSIASTLHDLGITLPAVSAPAAAYLPYVQSGKLVFVSGHISKSGGQVLTGQVGRDLDTAAAKQAARQVAIDLMGTLQDACGGDLERIARVVKLMGLVNSTPDYTEQHLVINGASELLAQVFGARGQHARSAFGVAQLPLGAAVEIELIVELQ